LAGRAYRRHGLGVGPLDVPLLPHHVPAVGGRPAAHGRLRGPPGRERRAHRSSGPREATRHGARLMSTTAAVAASRRNPLERCLGLFADVRPGEGVTVVLLMLNVFVLLCCYYIIKPVREALILGGESAEVKSYASAAMAVVLVGLVPAYGNFASRVDRMRLITVVSTIFV